ncbi:DUF2690 domain-containing protein [Streptacidiphilus sp. PB12-B1b]|uniref:helix-turn-helix domain-containing protein n=1 Tax=Streptacidiphilus sp. PB12-B1b TaxID=2705012 RepID=UPI0015F9DA21|nr:XRE family transcriptional regulator [Streptacidiphilus sp. PB12-B1b]QMU79243.1 DUF2690 domain-containing protein [Streptacidiphilus sp. PB12-B1b]
MTHWQQLPDSLDPDVRRLVEQLRLLKDRSGRSLQSLAEATACSKSAWQRYLNGTKFPPRAAVAGLGRITGADAPRLMLLWEVAEAAWLPDPLPPAAPPPVALVPAVRPAPPVPVAVRPTAFPAPDPLPLVVPGRPSATPRRPLVPVFALAGGALLLAAAGVIAAPTLWPGADVGGSPGLSGHPGRPDQDALTAGRCSGSSCQGRDPYATGCDRGATVAGSVDVDSLIVQLRYSPRCGAVWTHAQGGTRGMTLRSLSISGDNGSVLATVPVAGASASADHSPILAAGSPDRAEACAVVDDVQACAGTDDPGGPPRVLTYLPSGPG